MGAGARGHPGLEGLWYRKDGTLYRIGDRKVLDAEDEAEAARRKALVEMEAPRPDVFTLNYANADDLATKLAPLLSPKGKIEVDKRTNSLIVNDVKANRNDVIDLARRLDTQTPQLTIEARVVEARSNFKREFDIQWGGRANASAAGGNAIQGAAAAFTRGGAEHPDLNGVAASVALVGGGPVLVGSPGAWPTNSKPGPRRAISTVLISPTR